MIERYRDHAANERTFLAWVRTVIAIEGFGIVAARIGEVTAHGWSEAGMLAAGATVILLAYFRMNQMRRRINTKEASAASPESADALLVLLVLALFALTGTFALHVR